MRFTEILLWTVISVIWFALVRFIVVAAFSLPWWLHAKTITAAYAWLWAGTPAAVAFAAFLTIQTNIRNRELHQVMTYVIGVTAVWPHINLSVGNAHMAELGGALVAAWIAQAAAVAVGVAAGLALVKRRRRKAAERQPALPDMAA
jgi:hypothetical protein